MSSSIQSLSSNKMDAVPKGEGMRFSIVVSAYYRDITESLLNGCLDVLKQSGVRDKDITVEYCPGTFELPAACQMVYEKTASNAVIALGCVVKGETDHDIYINQSVAHALQQLSLQYQKPFLFGVLTPNTYEQAKDRAGGKHGNKGKEVAFAALEMVALQQRLENKE